MEKPRSPFSVVLLGGRARREGEGGVSIELEMEERGRKRDAKKALSGSESKPVVQYLSGVGGEGNYWLGHRRFHAPTAMTKEWGKVVRIIERYRQSEEGKLTA